MGLSSGIRDWQSPSSGTETHANSGAIGGKAICSASMSMNRSAASRAVKTALPRRAHFTMKVVLLGQQRNRRWEALSHLLNIL